MKNTEEKLIAIKNEMENVRELYVKGFINKEVYLVHIICKCITDYFLFTHFSLITH